MSKYDYDTLVFIGRFQPLHMGHMAVIKQALTLAEHVIIVVGSAYSSRSPKNPFTFAERKAMIEQAFHSEVSYENRLSVVPVSDTKNDDRWITSVRRAVLSITPEVHERIGLIGFGKDESSFYLKMFPDWLSVGAEKYFSLIDATAIRKQYFQRGSMILSDMLPGAVHAFLRKFRESEAYARLVYYTEFIDKYKKDWESAPYPPTFVTVDPVCVQSGHVLLVERKDEPGAGLLALPGGFLQAGKSLLVSAINELKEETNISDDKGEIPPAKLAGYIDHSRSRVFDEVNRSSRGRTITHAFFFQFPPTRSLFKVKGGSDAAKAAWYPTDSLRQEDFFEDHFQILEELNVINPKE